MITLDLNPLFTVRGIDKPFAFLRKAGFTHNTAHRLLDKPVSLHVGYIERLCAVLNCTPNDLFTFTPGDGNALPPDHQLFRLVRANTRGSLSKELHRLSPDEINKLWSMIDDLKTSGSGGAQ